MGRDDSRETPIVTFQVCRDEVSTGARGDLSFCEGDSCLPGTGVQWQRDGEGNWVLSRSSEPLWCWTGEGDAGGRGVRS
jgi:hypothetical protein